MTGKRSKEGPGGHLVLHPKNCDAQPSGRVAQALDIYRSIASCSRHLARSDDVHALTAAVMLPCYQAQFYRLARELTRAEANELASVLGRFRDSQQLSIAPAPASLEHELELRP